MRSAAPRPVALHTSAWIALTVFLLAVLALIPAGLAGTTPNLRADVTTSSPTPTASPDGHHW